MNKRELNKRELNKIEMAIGRLAKEMIKKDLTEIDGEYSNNSERYEFSISIKELD